MEKGILYDHLLDPEAYARGERKRIELSEKQKIELEGLNKRVLSEEQAQRWAEIIREKTEYGEKVILFAASQAHSLMLVRALNKVFNDPGESPRCAEAIISDNHDVTEALKEWFELPYANPRVVVSVDIMSTGVDIPCVRHIAFGALTKSVGKYIQMVGRGTRLDPKTGKFMFNVLDFVGLCARMKDNGRGSPQPNQKVVKPGEEEVEAIRQWAASPEIVLNEEQLQRIKEAFVANLSSQADIGVEAIFSNPIYQRLIGDFEELNRLFDGDLRGVVERMKTAFTLAA